MSFVNELPSDEECKEYVDWKSQKVTNVEMISKVIQKEKKDSLQIKNMFWKRCQTTNIKLKQKKKSTNFLNNQDIKDVYQGNLLDKNAFIFYLKKIKKYAEKNIKCEVWSHNVDPNTFMIQQNIDKDILTFGYKQFYGVYVINHKQKNIVIFCSDEQTKKMDTSVLVEKLPNYKFIKVNINTSSSNGGLRILQIVVKEVLVVKTAVEKVIHDEMYWGTFRTAVFVDIVCGETSVFNLVKKNV